MNNLKSKLRMRQLREQERNAERQQEEGKKEEQKQERLMITSDESSLQNTVKQLTQEYNELQRNDPENPKLRSIIQDIKSAKSEMKRIRHGTSPEKMNHIQSEVINLENKAASDIQQASQAESKDISREQQRINQRALKNANSTHKRKSSLDMTPEMRMQNSRNYQRAQEIQREYQEIQNKYNELNQRRYKENVIQQGKTEKEMNALRKKSEKLMKEYNKFTARG